MSCTSRLFFSSTYSLLHTAASSKFDSAFFCLPCVAFAAYLESKTMMSGFVPPCAFENRHVSAMAVISAVLFDSVSAPRYQVEPALVTTGPQSSSSSLQSSWAGPVFSQMDTPQPTAPSLSPPSVYAIIDPTGRAAICLSASLLSRICFWGF